MIPTGSAISRTRCTSAAPRPPPSPPRRFVVATTRAEAVRLHNSPEPARAGSREVGAELPNIGFVCPGQGSQYPRMGYGLYHSEPAFRAAYDECCDLLAAFHAF